MIPSVLGKILIAPAAQFTETCLIVTQRRFLWHDVVLSPRQHMAMPSQKRLAKVGQERRQRRAISQRSHHRPEAGLVHGLPMGGRVEFPPCFGHEGSVSEHGAEHAMGSAMTAQRGGHAVARFDHRAPVWDLKSGGVGWIPESPHGRDRGVVQRFHAFFWHVPIDPARHQLVDVRRNKAVQEGVNGGHRGVVEQGREEVHHALCSAAPSHVDDALVIALNGLAANRGDASLNA